MLPSGMVTATGLPSSPPLWSWAQSLAVSCQKPAVRLGAGEERLHRVEGLGLVELKRPNGNHGNLPTTL